MHLRQILTDIVAEAFEKSGYPKQYGTVTPSDRPDLCQFQCNGALAAAKEYKKAPIAIASEVAEHIQSDKHFSKVEVVKPGFINIDITPEFTAELMNRMCADSRLCLPMMEHKTIVVDYGGPNLAKSMHVGHLRSAIIGEALYRLAKFLGHTVIGDTHFGDWGLQMGLVISESKLRMPELPFFNPDYQGEYPETLPFTVEELNEIYPAASKHAKEDKTFAEQAAAATVEVQSKRRGYYEFWKLLWELSVNDLKKSYDILNVHFDYWYGESDAQPYIPLVLEKLKERGLLYESDGAMVVDVSQPDDKEPMPPIILVKSNGGEIYGSTDLGTLYQRVKDWQPDEVWYFTDYRQTLHFKQVFRCAKLAGITDNTECLHISFGTMNGKDGKPYKTRDGGVMRLSDMIELVTDNAYKRASESGLQMSVEQKTEVARIVGVAAMKIGDFINHRAKDFVFDIDKFLSSEGKTGPYLLYTAVRIKSVLSKADAMGFSPAVILPPSTPTEQRFMLSLTSVYDSLLRAYSEKAPNIICDTLFEITGLFNKFYGENKILTCPDTERRDSWLGLLKLAYDMISILLTILGISIPEQM